MRTVAALSIVAQDQDGVMVVMPADHAVADTARFHAAVSAGVQQAAAGTTQVAGNITDVNRGAAETGAASSQVLSSAQSLANESNRLKLEVQKFLATVRAA